MVLSIVGISLMCLGNLLFIFGNSAQNYIEYKPVNKSYYRFSTGLFAGCIYTNVSSNYNVKCYKSLGYLVNGK